MEKEIVFVLLDDFADWEAAFLAPPLYKPTFHASATSFCAQAETSYVSPSGVTASTALATDTSITSARAKANPRFNMLLFLLCFHSRDNLPKLLF